MHKLKRIGQWLVLNAIGLFLVAGMTIIVIASFLIGHIIGLYVLGAALLILAIILAIPGGR
ncbi:hypothetical protein [Loigolactobacillus bifermentans]|uniref:Uncharacterized protein n=1 Tax=Loigolactobacillus bifermentans DSM 20003 TaxID=1423726 RepID=A0A0R1H3D3_9LACO|nr:hypothetical protein [Loigolactobacillus bifermentans]KRK40901.1 hypothetical protein FC07_GL002654 [Loigolactobacillus bifermentans DSM 20003]QGG59652.1 hypothetical protein LB003_03680 [Loigolactobacillus bifermentans]